MEKVNAMKEISWRIAGMELGNMFASVWLIQETGRTTGRKGSGSNNGGRGNTTRGNGWTVTKVDTDNSISMMEAFIVDSSAVIRSMGMVYTTGGEWSHMRVNGSIIECQERGYSHSKTARNTMASSKMINITVREDWSILTAVFPSVSSSRERNMVNLARLIHLANQEWHNIIWVRGGDTPWMV